MWGTQSPSSSKSSLQHAAEQRKAQLRSAAVVMTAMLCSNTVRSTAMSALTAAAAFDLSRPAARQFDGQAPLLEDARGWEGYGTTIPQRQ